MSTPPDDGARHDEPNEYGFAGETTAPQPERPNRPDELDEAEEEAIPADDLTEGLSDSLETHPTPSSPATASRDPDPPRGSRA